MTVDPTADAAKLLPTCWNCLGTGILPSFSGGNSRCPICNGTGSSSKPDTRPQPAPPEGEPDFLRQAQNYYQGETLAPNDKLLEVLAEFGEHMYRLGLAARPKVADAEVEAAITYLGDEVPEEKAIADLLERLAGELAEREAELATAYEVIKLCRSALEGAPSLIAREAIVAWDTKRDVARQQQKGDK